ncbi:4523_t:CDS:2, partial [Dentiscutata erythropus]
AGVVIIYVAFGVTFVVRFASGVAGFRAVCFSTAVIRVIFVV